jgi:hypothetical protein
MKRSGPAGISSPSFSRPCTPPAAAGPCSHQPAASGLPPSFHGAAAPAPRSPLHRAPHSALQRSSPASPQWLSPGRASAWPSHQPFNAWAQELPTITHTGLTMLELSMHDDEFMQLLVGDSTPADNVQNTLCEEEFVNSLLDAEEPAYVQSTMPNDPCAGSPAKRLRLENDAPTEPVDALLVTNTLPQHEPLRSQFVEVPPVAQRAVALLPRPSHGAAPPDAAPHLNPTATDHIEAAPAVAVSYDTVMSLHDDLAARKAQRVEQRFDRKLRSLVPHPQDCELIKKIRKLKVSRTSVL